MVLKLHQSESLNVLQNAPNCTRTCLNFQNFPERDAPGPPPSSLTFGPPHCSYSFLRACHDNFQVNQGKMTSLFAFRETRKTKDSPVITNSRKVPLYGFFCLVSPKNTPQNVQYGKLFLTVACSLHGMFEPRKDTSENGG